MSDESEIYPRYNKRVIWARAVDCVTHDDLKKLERIATSGVLTGLKIAMDIPLDHPPSPGCAWGSAQHLREEIERLVADLEK